eukprot:Hpha_TRINITY_DN15735_c0_g1::TRINITY_DN15735_c0_g1_i1::g.41931::m.41931
MRLLFALLPLAAASCSSPFLPQGVHLALTPSVSDSMMVSFYTCNPSPNPPVAVVGDMNFVGSSRTLTRTHHNVLLTGLEPGKQYQYYVYLDAATHSQTFTFRTAASSPGFVAAIVGDMGVNNSANTMRQLGNKYDFVHHVGDLAYADDFKLPLHIEPSSGTSYEGVYDLFQNSMQNVTAVTPYMVSPGNHDVTCHVTDDLGCPQQQRNFSAFNARYTMPSKHPHNMWYSYDFHSVHFVSISTESDFPNAPTTPDTKIGGGAGGGFGDQLAWLEADLARAQADPKVEFVVVLGHRPWYSTKGTDWPLLAPSHVKKAFEPLFFKYGVDLYLCGHKHFYERVEAAYEGKANANGTAQIINGAAGNNEGVDKGKGNGGLVVASNYQTQGYGELAYSNRSLTWRYVLSNTGAVVDEVKFMSRR